ncbi:YihY/virulence factor BrkB family protein [Actinophytocola sp.]|uniref:YihY/virulence factor BrkB family protein n=1 Tax=Actinophytocola sp. TaxID=1872138 RepID=UPI002D7E9A81|nr:YihY/virulence factor BrkB family protein [Actinophytocola sp.]HET9138336.1 YihY/virulence factor BrkB family protein [Actinophytocola sp.]
MSVATVPKGPTDLSRRSWWGVLRRTFREFNDDNLGDWAAALTYRSVMSIFPMLVVLIAVLGMLGPSATRTVTDTITQLVPGQGRDLLLDVVAQLQSARTVASPIAIFGLALALWSASGYVASFIRASNAIYEVEEGRPVWKTWPLRLGITLVVVVLLTACAVGVIATGALADRIGQLLGIGSTGVLIWEIAKWPVIALLVSLVFALLYWVSPNVRLPGFRWVSPGGLLAVAIWALASVGFALYIANFGSYNKTYGSLAGVIVFLVWLWLSNVAILLGAELDAELIRGRQLEAGQPDEEPFLPPRDTRASDDE